MRIFLIVFTLAALTVACSKGQPAPAASAAPTPNAPTANPSAQANAAAATPSSASEAGSAGGLHWSAPKPLVSRPPKSSMRAAEYGVEGDDTAELVVSYFGADQGGSVEANMTRWIAQFSQADGSATAPQRSERTVHGNHIALVEVRGTYSGGMAMPGAPPKAAQPDAALLGAIVNGPSGAVFFKLVGARAGVESARPAFDALLESLTVAP